MNVKLQLLTCFPLIAFTLNLVSLSQSVKADQLLLSNILPKLEAIHADTKSLLIKNKELKAKILIGLQTQNEARLKFAKENPIVAGAGSGDKPNPTTTPLPASNVADLVDNIDYSELEEFNKWVDANLEYGVKNVHASIEALREEAAQGNGHVDYSEQAIQDGIEGVKYWQSAVIFQDKTLRNEKYDPPTV